MTESKSGVLPLTLHPNNSANADLSTLNKLEGGIWGSNPRHPEPQSGALPTELIPPNAFASRSTREDAGTPRGIRTPDLLLRRQLLYPAELLARMSLTNGPLGFLRRAGAGDGNRTHVSSLEGWCSTIELHPQVLRYDLVGVTGFEPATPCSQSRCSSQTEPHPDSLCCLLP